MAEPTSGDTKNENKSSTDQQNGEEASSPPVKEMRAIVLTSFGGLKSVKVQKKPEPQAGEGEVIIRVKAWWV